MEFENMVYFYVEECDLDEMVDLCKRKHWKPDKAFEEVSDGWDDYEFYLSDIFKP